MPIRLPLRCQLDGGAYQVAQGRAPPDRIVKAFDIVEDVGARHVARAIEVPRRAFRSERGEESLHHRGVAHVARPTDTARESETARRNRSSASAGGRQRRSFVDE